MSPPPLPPTATPMPFQGPFLERLILFLMPYFLAITPDAASARVELLETMASYGACTRAEMLNVAQIIAFSMSALDLLAESRMMEMSPSLRLRFCGCANGLNRSRQQNEQTLAKRIASDLPDAADTDDASFADIPDHQVESALQQARTSIDAYRHRLSGTHPAAGPTSAPPQEPDRQPSRKAVMARLGEFAAPA